MYPDVKITVIVFVNGDKEKLERCIESIKSQTHEMYECFVMLREESDIAEADIMRYADNRFSVMMCSKDANDNDMFGQGFSWKCTDSVYTICVDSNDWMEIDYFTQMIDAMKHIDADVVCGGTIVGEDIGIVEGAVWNKIYRREINWANLQIRSTYGASYHRSNSFVFKYEHAKEYDARLDNLKRAIFDNRYRYISFDIFDTVVQRPFYDPQDLFLLLDVEFEKCVNANISFSKLRKIAEADLRQKLESPNEDVTIDEIYENIIHMFRFDTTLAHRLEEFEKKLEIKYSQCRKTGKELFELAKKAGKQIVFVSDMYLDRKTVETVLKINDYNEYERLFLSSEYKRLKGTGNLYDCVINELRVEPTQILHIGDNYVKDVEWATKKGISAYHLPSALARFDDHDYIKGKSVATTMTKKVCGGFISYEKIADSLGYRCMIAQVANKYFDNPYRQYNSQSVLNQDPYLVGYYLVGSYLLAINQWIAETVRGKYNKIYFTSRDGYMPMMAYKIMKRYQKDLPEEEYFYTSRQCVLPAMIKSEMDFYDLPIDRARYSPRKLYELLQFATQSDEDEWRLACVREGIPFEENFASDAQLISLIAIFVEKFYCKKKHMESLDFLRGYYDRIDAKSILFDMGYSGRIQSAVTELAGEAVDVMFVHSDSKTHDTLSRRGKFKIYSLLDYVPQMSDVLREYLLSAPTPTCIGYTCKDAEYAPIFDMDDMSAGEKELIQTIQRGAVDFVEEFYGNFGELLEYVPYKSGEMALPLEGFLRYSNDADRLMLSEVKFDDVLYGGERAISLKELIELALEWLPKYAEEE